MSFLKGKVISLLKQLRYRDTAIIAGGDWSAKQKTEKAMAITKDGGISWQLKTNNPGYISCVQFIPKTKTLVACSTTGIY